MFDYPMLYELLAIICSANITDFCISKIFSDHGPIKLCLPTILHFTVCVIGTLTILRGLDEIKKYLK